MGLICSSRLLVRWLISEKISMHIANKAQDLAPALIESIKTAGLVLVTDITDSVEAGAPTNLHVANPRRQLMPDGVDGYLRGNGVLCFNETVDM